MLFLVVTPTQSLHSLHRNPCEKSIRKPIGSSIVWHFVAASVVFLLSQSTLAIAQPKAGPQSRPAQPPIVAPKEVNNRRLEAEDRRRLRQDIRSHVEEMRAKSLVLPAKNTTNALMPNTTTNAVSPSLPVLPTQPGLTTPAVSPMSITNPHGLSPQERIQLRQQIKEQPKYFPTPTEVDR
jgi:hypothetical protein